MTLLIKNEPVQERQLLPKHKYTIEEFEQLFAEAEHGDRLLELIHGEIVEKMPTEEHGVIAGNVFAPLHNIDILHEGDMLNGEDILPGFTLAVSDIFADPFTELSG